MNDYLHYIQTIVEIIKDEAKDEKKSLDKSRTQEDKKFYQSNMIGYYRAISIMQQEAKLMQIPLSELKLDDIDPDNDIKKALQKKHY